MTGAIHQLSAIDALASLNSGPDGLDDAEAARRLGEFGPNRVEHVRRALPSLRLLKEFGHFFAIVLWIAAGLSFVADRMGPGELGYGILGCDLRIGSDEEPLARNRQAATSAAELQAVARWGAPAYLALRPMGGPAVVGE